MKAFVLNEKKLELHAVAKPEIKANQVLIKTKSISLNPVDYKVTQGAFNLSTPRIIGIDVAGEVIEIGADVADIVVGDKVFGMVNIFETGSFAEFVAMDSEALSLMPEGLSYQDAATLPCAGITAWQAIMEKINLRKGQTIFITSGNGAVGNFAIQLAKFKGATVITSASKNFEELKSLGADYVIDYKQTDVKEGILSVTNGKGVDYIINSRSGVDIEQLAEALRFNGAIVGIAGIPKQYPFKPFTKAAGVSEVALVAAYSGGDKESLREISLAGKQLADLVASKAVKTSINTVLGFEQIPHGLELISKGEADGKIVIHLD